MAAEATFKTKPKLTLAIPGRFSKEILREFESAGIEVWDLDWISAKSIQVGLEQEATRFLGPDSPLHKIEPLGVLYSRRIAELPDGKSHWSEYQALCEKAFEYLFSPPLAPPLRELNNQSKTNRRDIIMPNYADRGPWKFLRNEYHADYLTVDAKNYKGYVKKEQVLQMANYLQRHGGGLFGVIISRNGSDYSARHTIREQWVLHDKLIVVIDDEDMHQMLTVRSGGSDPTELIIQKIEDFRLSI